MKGWIRGVWVPIGTTSCFEDVAEHAVLPNSNTRFEINHLFCVGMIV